MMKQIEVQLPRYKRGFHLITNDVQSALGALPEFGMLHVFIMHTSAGISLNENADPSVRADMESTFNRLVPESESNYTHTQEGPDDMPAHVKSSLVGSSVSIPITNGQLNLGTWQGIYLCEFRDRGGRRSLLCTIH